MILTGDCIEQMAGMPADSVDAVVTDPPYGLEFMGKGWDQLSTDKDIGKARDVGLSKPDGAPDQREHNKGGTWFGSREATVPNYHRATNAKCRKCGKWRVSGGHDGKGNTLGCKCASPDFPNVEREAAVRMQEWHYAWAVEALRVTKPGGYLLAFGGTRTHHRLVCGLEDAGWIIRDELDWIYASGFPKGKANLKPAHEPIVLARKPGPLRPLAIDACRIGYASEADTPTQEEWNRAGSSGAPGANGYAGQFSKGMKDAYAEGKIPVPPGRWPSNVLLSDPELFDVANPGVMGSGAMADGATSFSRPKDYAASSYQVGDAPLQPGYGDSGGYSRFFIIPKADRGDREPVLRPDGHEKGKRFTSHPTVKPTDLMRHLIRLVTPRGGTILDPFAGSGSTGVAATLEGFPFILIEKEPEYVAQIEARLNGVQRGLGLDVGAPVRKQKTIGQQGPWTEAYSGYSQGWGRQRDKPPEEAA
jgi:DNA modification methylase